MRILVTGKGGSAGSWTIRGEQLGVAMGATVRPLADVETIRSHDVAVVVKRTPWPLLDALRVAGRKWAYDVVDCYPQPDAAGWGRDEAIRWIRQHIKSIRPNGLIWPNERMRDDCKIDLPSIVLYHHHRPGIRQNPVRDFVRRIGYEGCERYLDRWRPLIESECYRRGWEFAVNPEQLADLDVVLSLRGGQWSGYVPHHWKSNVKLANAHASGTPFIGQRECGYTETATGYEMWVETEADLRAEFNAIAPWETRVRISEGFRLARIPVAKQADQMKEFLRAL